MFLDLGQRVDWFRAVDIVHVPIVDAVGPLGVRLQHHLVVFVFFKGDDAVRAGEVGLLKLDWGHARELEGDAQSRQSAVGIDRNQGRLVGHDRGQ